MFEIVRPDTHIDFIGRWKLCAIASLVVIAVGIVAAVGGGLRWGIDFAGGTEVLVRFTGAEPVEEGVIRDAVRGAGVEDPAVVRFGDESQREYLIRFGGELDAEAGEPSPTAAAEPAADAPTAPEAAEAPEVPIGGLVADGTNEIVDELVAALGEQVGAVELDRVEFVGPRVGAELRRAGVQALLIAGVLILVYVAFRFSLRFAPGAVVALLHDVLITSSIWVLLGQEFNLQVLAALLAIVGYSLNDTIIVYDRIRENMELRTTFDLPEVLNRSVNQTLSRTILTSGTTLVAVTALLVLGGDVIRPFALAMAIGILVGTYSSVYIAAPMLLWLEQRFGSTAAEGAAQSKRAKTARV